MVRWPRARTRIGDNHLSSLSACFMDLSVVTADASPLVTASRANRFFAEVLAGRGPPADAAPSPEPRRRRSPARHLRHDRQRAPAGPIAGTPSRNHENRRRRARKNRSRQQFRPPLRSGPEPRWRGSREACLPSRARRPLTGLPFPLSGPKRSGLAPGPSHRTPYAPRTETAASGISQDHAGRPGSPRASPYCRANARAAAHPAGPEPRATVKLCSPGDSANSSRISSSDLPSCFT